MRRRGCEDDGTGKKGREWVYGWIMKSSFGTMATDANRCHMVERAMLVVTMVTLVF